MVKAANDQLNVKWHH